MVDNVISACITWTYTIVTAALINFIDMRALIKQSLWSIRNNNENKATLPANTNTNLIWPFPLYLKFNQVKS